MDTTVWGPSAWLLIHSIAVAYPMEDVPSNIKDNTRNFFLSLENTLPCVYCQENYSNHLDRQALEEALESRAALFKWTVDLHNTVNRSLNKKELTYDEAIRLLEKQYRQRKFFTKWTVIWLLLVILLITGVAVYLHCKRTRYFK
jgi:hypothetical protein